MELTNEEKEMLAGKQGEAVKSSMNILVSLGEIFGAKRLIDVNSVQVAGVSYHNLGEAGLGYLSDLAKDGKVKVLTTLKPLSFIFSRIAGLSPSPARMPEASSFLDTGFPIFTSLPFFSITSTKRLKLIVSSRNGYFKGWF